MVIFGRVLTALNRPPQRHAARLLLLAPLAMTGCQIVEAAAPDASTQLSATERTYVRQTARTVYRRGGIEYTPAFLFAGPEGYGICVRAAGSGADGRDYTLLVLQERVGGDTISQAADDVLIYRQSSEVRECRRVGADAWRWRPVP